MRTAMQNLRERWGLGTSEIARALDISQRVARLARDGSEDAGEAGHLDDFLERLHVQASIDEPGAWMSSPIADGYTVTRWDVYVGGHPEFVVMNAESSMSDQEMLLSFDPDWRRNYWSSSTTFVAADGNLSTRGQNLRGSPAAPRTPVSLDLERKTMKERRGVTQQHPAKENDMGKPPPDTSWIKMTTIREGRQPLTEDETFERTDRRLITLCIFLAGAAFGVLLAAAGVWLAS